MMNDIDAFEPRKSNDQQEYCGGATGHDNPVYFDPGLEQAGGQIASHIRNKLGKLQRPTITTFQPGTKKKPAFHISCTAKAIIHGTLDENSGTLATLLIYDFFFFPDRTSRIKAADILFEFQPKDRSTADKPIVLRISPNAKYKLEQTTTAEGSLESTKSIEKTTSHAAEIIGSKWCDEFGDHFQAHWYTKEIGSQKNGIMTLLRTCILLTRTNNEEFLCFPYIKAEPDFRSRLKTLASSQGPSHPILYSPEYESYNLLEAEQGLKIDKKNLGAKALDLDKIWDCTFAESYDNVSSLRAQKTEVYIERAPGSFK